MIALQKFHFFSESIDLVGGDGSQGKPIMHLGLLGTSECSTTARSRDSVLCKSRKALRVFMAAHRKLVESLEGRHTVYFFVEDVENSQLPSKMHHER